MARLKDLKERLMKNKDFAMLYEAKKPLMDFLNDVIDMMNEKGISQAELAEKIGIQRSNMSRIMSGKQNLTYEMMKKISDALGADLLVALNKGQFVKLSRRAQVTLEKIAEQTKADKEEILEGLLATFDYILSDTGKYAVEIMKEYKHTAQTDFMGAFAMIFRSGAESLQDFLNEYKKYSDEYFENCEYETDIEHVIESNKGCISDLELVGG